MNWETRPISVKERLEAALIQFVERVSDDRNYREDEETRVLYPMAQLLTDLLKEEE